MVMYGADVDQLRAAAAQLSGGAGALENSARALHSLIGNGTYWRGPDAERFRAEWTSSSMPTIALAVESLRNAADQLRRHADEQDVASRPDGALGAAGSPGPRGASELFAHIVNDRAKSRELGDDDGVRIERVIGPDVETRLIVYFKGEGSVDARDSARSIALGAGKLGVDPEITREIDEALSTTPNGKRTEVMLVGHSQGGMDAQNIAAAGKYNVTALVTYGSPIIQADAPGVATVHMRADGDPVPGAGGALSKVADGQYIPGIGLGEFLVDVFKPPPSDSVFSHNPDMGIGMHVHADGYPDVARAFDASTDARFDEVRQRMKAFQGRVIETVE